MAELRLVGVSEDGSHLVLTDDQGEQHTITVDERLRAGVNGHLSRLGQLTMALESRISPRDIQNRVRGGESAEHVAQTAGVPLDRVLRFVGPVLREREHVADQARQARLAGSNGPILILADLVTRAANRQGVDPDDVVWDSARREDHSWVVVTRWPDDTTATWALDASRHQATAVDLAARRISGPLDDVAPNVDAGARDFPDMAGSSAFARFDADDRPAATEAIKSDVANRAEATVHQFVPRSLGAGDTDVDTADVDDATPLLAEATAGVEVDTADVAAAEPDVAAKVSRPSPNTASGQVGQNSPNSQGGQGGRSARRAKVPRWDDIMFGLKPKE